MAALTMGRFAKTPSETSPHSPVRPQRGITLRMAAMSNPVSVDSSHYLYAPQGGSSAGLSERNRIVPRYISS